METIPRKKKPKLVDCVTKKNNVIGYLSPSVRKINMKKINHHQTLKSVPIYKDCPHMRIDIHTITFNQTTPQVWSTLMLLSPNRTVKHIMTEAFNYDSIKRHFPLQLSQHIMDNLSKENTATLQFNPKIFGDESQKEKFQVQKEFIHQQKVKQAMIEEASFYSSSKCESSAPLPMMNHFIGPPRCKPKPKSTKKWNNKKKSSVRRMNMQRRNFLDDIEQQITIHSHRWDKSGLIFNCTQVSSHQGRVLNSQTGEQGYSFVRMKDPVQTAIYVLNRMENEDPTSTTATEFVNERNKQDMAEMWEWAKHFFDPRPPERTAAFQATRREYRDIKFLSYKWEMGEIYFDCEYTHTLEGTLQRVANEQWCPLTLELMFPGKFALCIIETFPIETLDAAPALVHDQDSKDKYERLKSLSDWAHKILAPININEPIRNFNAVTVQMDTAKMFTKITEVRRHKLLQLGYMDSASDTCGMGGNAWIIDYEIERKEQVIGYHKKDTAMNHIKIGGGITAMDLPNKETILIRVCEATLLGEDANTLFSVAQMRDHGVFIDDVPKKHGGKSYMEVEGTVIPLFMNEGMIA